METKKVNNSTKFNKSFSPGVALDQDLRNLIVDTIIKERGDRTTGYNPCTLMKLSIQLCASSKTIKSVWYRFCEEITNAPKRKGGVTHSKLQEGDLELIEVLKVHSPSISLSDFIQELQRPEISICRLSCAPLKTGHPQVNNIQGRNSQNWQERDLPRKTCSTHTFSSTTFHQKIHINFFDEAGVKAHCVDARTYGHSAKGTRSVEVIRKHETPNKTLSMLVSLEGPAYHNIINGGTNTARFLQFFEEACKAANIQTGRPCLDVGDIVVMDNLSAHHYEGGVILEELFDPMEI